MYKVTTKKNLRLRRVRDGQLKTGDMWLPRGTYDLKEVGEFPGFNGPWAGLLSGDGENWGANPLEWWKSQKDVVFKRDYEELGAGRELDGLVAELYLGYFWWKEPRGEFKILLPPEMKDRIDTEDAPLYTRGQGSLQFVPEFSSDWNAAAEVILKAVREGQSFVVDQRHREYFTDFPADVCQTIVSNILEEKGKEID